MVYLGLMDLTGSALTSPADSGAEKTAQVLLTVDGMAFIPVITAIVVGARLTGSVRRAPRLPGGHVIVVGLGNVGTSVTGQLHDLGFDVACVDNNPGAAGIPMARQLGLPVVIGDAFREETADRRRPGRARAGRERHRGHRARRAGSGARAAGRRGRRARLVPAPRLPARGRRPDDRAGHQEGAGAVPLRAARRLVLLAK
jgi:hypothetical protein